MEAREGTLKFAGAGAGKQCVSGQLGIANLRLGVRPHFF
jgi:hypothetical protein